MWLWKETSHNEKTDPERLKPVKPELRQAAILKAFAAFVCGGHALLLRMPAASKL